MVTNVGRRLRDMIARERAAQEKWLGEGSATDFATYKYQVGLLRGMEVALEFLEEIERED